jgi:hypothetical protein
LSCDLPSQTDPERDFDPSRDSRAQIASHGR